MISTTNEPFDTKHHMFGMFISLLRRLGARQIKSRSPKYTADGCTRRPSASANTHRSSIQMAETTEFDVPYPNRCLLPVPFVPTLIQNRRTDLCHLILNPTIARHNFGRPKSSIPPSMAPVRPPPPESTAYHLPHPTAGVQIPKIHRRDRRQYGQSQSPLHHPSAGPAPESSKGTNKVQIQVRFGPTVIWESSNQQRIRQRSNTGYRQTFIIAPRPLLDSPSAYVWVHQWCKLPQFPHPTEGPQTGHSKENRAQSWWCHPTDRQSNVWSIARPCLLLQPISVFEEIEGSIHERWRLQQTDPPSSHQIYTTL